MPVHAAQGGGCGGVLPVEALEDPVLEDGVHGYGHDGHEYVDGRILRSRRSFNKHLTAPVAAHVAVEDDTGGVGRGEGHVRLQERMCR